MKRQAILICSISAVLLSAAHALTLDTVTVGNPGNPDDATGYGGVATTYAIGKYEVTLNQYTEFLNAVADTDDFGLYNTNMELELVPYGLGIARANSPGSYAYSVIGDGQRPVTFVSWFDAARFSNWLHNGQPSTGSQTAGTTETGAYALNGTISGVGISKGGGAQYWIPSESEWYKAAYYQPAAVGGDADGYWLYPMQTNSVPYSDQPAGGTPDNTRVGNFYADDSLANGYNDGYAVYTGGNGLTPVGAYTSSDSYYGTFDQGGNVWEWNDAIISSSRGLRGGSWNFLENYLLSSFRYNVDPSLEFYNIGFRIASVPEPTVSVSLMLAGGLWLARRKRPSAL